MNTCTVGTTNLVGRPDASPWIDDLPGEQVTQDRQHAGLGMTGDGRHAVVARGLTVAWIVRVSVGSIGISLGGRRVRLLTQSWTWTRKARS